MSAFDPQKKYQEQEETFFDDGREIELLHFVYSKPNIDEIRGNPDKVLAAIDEFARTKKYLMNVGEDKGKIVADLIAEVRPKVMVELGGYIGYSCILFGHAVRQAGGEKYYSLERNPEFAAVIASLVDLAGLSEVVKVVVGSSDASITRLHTTGVLHRIDLMFLDHYKPAYTTDLKLCEELRLIGPGSVLAADNVIKPGNPPYLEYVRSTVDQKRSASKGSTVNGVDTRFADRTAQQYAKREGAAKLDETRVGNPNLEYQSQLVNSWEPSGVPNRTASRLLDVWMSGHNSLTYASVTTLIDLHRLAAPKLVARPDAQAINSASEVFSAGPIAMPRVGMGEQAPELHDGHSLSRLMVEGYLVTKRLAMVQAAGPLDVLPFGPVKRASSTNWLFSEPLL